MVLLRSFALWLLLSFLQQQVSMTSAARAADKTSGRAQRNGSKSPAAARGKFSTRNKLQCSWAGRENEESAKLRVTCEKPEAQTSSGVTNLQCEYDAKPQSCAGYLADAKGFWKQVGRALKRMQSRVCKDELALVKTGMCKRAPAAHFKVNITTITALARSGGPAATPTPLPPTSRPTSVGSTACTKRADHRETAEEYCGSSWASLCSFFLSMLQSDEC